MFCTKISVWCWFSRGRPRPKSFRCRVKRLCKANLFLRVVWTVFWRTRWSWVWQPARNMGCEDAKWTELLEASTNNNNNNSVASVCLRTIPTERPPLVGEVSANSWWQKVQCGQRDGFLQPYSRLSRSKLLLFLPRSSSIVLTRLSGPAVVFSGNLYFKYLSRFFQGKVFLTLYVPLRR
jgi:hypothetical protein